MIADAVDIKYIEGTSLILYGRGNKLHLTGDHFRGVLKISTCDKIHKISVRKKNDNSFKVACAAGRKVLLVDIVDSAFQNSLIVNLSDRVSSIKVLKNESIVILSSHNLVALLEIDNGKAVIKDKIRCDENSTLYCSFIHGDVYEELLFFGATALGELVVSRRGDEGCSQIIHRQYLHNGVIFSIDYHGSYLTSSSDDRSIKIFDVYNSDNSFHLTERKQLFGHLSRVFVCKIINFNQENVFLSAGEDSNLCVWSESGELLCKKNISTSGIIWHLDYCLEKESIVTCSSTGKLNIFKLREILFDSHRTVNFKVEKVDPASGNPAKLKYLENRTLVVLDSEMNIYMQLQNDEWTKLTQPMCDRKFVAMEVVKNRLLLAAKSSVVVFDFSDEEKLLKYTTELEIKKMLQAPAQLDYLRSIHAISFNELFVCDASGLCCVIDVKLEEISQLLQIPKSIEPWTTSVAKTGEFWLVGDRVGNLFVYGNQVTSPLYKLWKLHGHLGVTTIKTNENGVIRTTGNDGTVKTLLLNKTTNPPSIEVLQCERTPVNWIEKVSVWNGRNYLLGFNDNYFVIYHKRQIIYEHKCGGRHRHWDIALSDDRQKVSFTYIQKKQLNFVEFLLTDFAFDLSYDISWHTKECNAIKVVDDLLISGGEDTTLKLTKFKFIDNEPKFQEIANINSHISSIKAITTAKDGEDLLIFSAGGRAQIVVTRFVKMQHVKEELNFLLSKPSSSKDSSYDPETRFTSIFYDVTSHHLYLAASDGFIRVFKYTKDYLKIIVAHFYEKCLLKIHVLEEFILTMSTNGFVCFWLRNNSSPILKLVDKIKHNESGINCFDVFKKNDDGIFSLGTSGDDTGIFITDFKINGTKIEFLRTTSSNSVHESQVTGLKFVEKDVLYTTSVDQTICKLQINNSTIKIVDKKLTCVSDVKGLLFLSDEKLKGDDRHIAVFGAGFEVL